MLCSRRPPSSIALILLSVALHGCAEDSMSPPLEHADSTTRKDTTNLRTYQSKLACRPGEVSARTSAIVQALEPHCADCHQSGPRGFFKSVDAFQQLIVNDPGMIVPGHPEASEFVRLLEGDGTGAFTQMPIGAETYAQMVQAGTATLTMEEIKDWIRELDQGDMTGSRAPDPAAQRVRRLKAIEIERALYKTLGLDETDFFKEELSHTNGIDTVIRRSDKLYPIRSPDALPASYYGEPQDRFLALGGFSIIRQTSEDTGYAPAALLTLNQVSQAWCRLAVSKVGNTTLFGAPGTPPGTEAGVKALISRWSLHFLAERFDDAQVDAIHDELYQPLLLEADAEAAFTGVCSYFIRHPKWIVL